MALTFSRTEAPNRRGVSLIFTAMMIVGGLVAMHMGMRSAAAMTTGGGLPT